MVHSVLAVAYNLCMRHTIVSLLGCAVLSGASGLSSGCVAALPAIVKNEDLTGPMVVGRAVTVLTGERGRRFEPKVRFFEVENRDTHQRFNIDVDAQDRYFALALPSGDYRINRVQISEGPFMSMADLTATFSVGPQTVTHVGTWRFGVGSPGYGRMVAVSMVMTPEEVSKAREFLKSQYPEAEDHPLLDALPQPSQMETRLYEVMPYPRYPRYFRRHWW